MIRIFRFLKIVLSTVLCASMITVPVHVDLAQAQSQLWNFPVGGKNLASREQLTIPQSLDLDADAIESLFQEVLSEAFPNVDFSNPETSGFVHQAAEGAYTLLHNKEAQSSSINAFHQIFEKTKNVQFSDSPTLESVRLWADALNSNGNADLLDFLQDPEGLGYTVTESSSEYTIIRLDEGRVEISASASFTPEEIGLKLLFVYAALLGQQANLSQEEFLALINLSEALKGLVDDLIALYLGVLVVLFLLVVITYGGPLHDLIVVLYNLWRLPLFIFIYVSLCLVCTVNYCGPEVEDLCGGF